MRKTKITLEEAVYNPRFRTTAAQEEAKRTARDLLEKVLAKTNTKRWRQWLRWKPAKNSGVYVKAGVACSPNSDKVYVVLVLRKGIFGKKETKRFLVKTAQKRAYLGEAETKDPGSFDKKAVRKAFNEFRVRGRLMRIEELRIKREQENNRDILRTMGKDEGWRGARFSRGTITKKVGESFINMDTSLDFNGFDIEIVNVPYLKMRKIVKILEQELKEESNGGTK